MKAEWQILHYQSDVYCFNLVFDDGGFICYATGYEVPRGFNLNLPPIAHGRKRQECIYPTLAHAQRAAEIAVLQHLEAEVEAVRKLAGTAGKLLERMAMREMKEEGK